MWDTTPGGYSDKLLASCNSLKGLWKELATQLYSKGLNQIYLQPGSTTLVSMLYRMVDALRMGQSESA